jgi:hypothetical protein
MRKTTLVLLIVFGLLFVAPILAAPLDFTMHVIDGDLDGATGVYATDLDHDGDRDVLSAGFGADDIVWYENDGSEQFTRHTIDSDFDGAYDVLAADLDRDGDEDLLGSGHIANDVAWWENQGGDPPTFAKHVIDDDFDGACDVLAADLDADSDPDILSTANRGGQIAWWENDGGNPPSFAKHIVDDDFQCAAWLQAVDLDEDGDEDIVGTGDCADEVAWWENDGSANFTKHSIEANLDGAIGVCVTDLNRDGYVDVVGTARVQSDVIWWESDGETPPSFAKHVIDNNLQGAFAVQAADLDHDGDEDIVVSAYQGDEIVWYENDGQQNFDRRVVAPNLDGAYLVCADDLDEDGDVDVLAAAYSAGDVAWWENVTDGAGPVVSAVLVSPNPVGVEDSTLLSATIDDSKTGNSSIVLAEWYAGADPGQGFAEPMTALDGAFDEPAEEVQSSILASDLGVGVHAVYVRGQDRAGNWGDPTPAYLVVYDRSAGFATGGGWIIPGTEPGDLLPGITGQHKANFGFVVKYKKGATTPDGQLEFHYRVGDFNLHSTEMHWMAVNSNWAKFQGDATINLHPDELFYFRVDARDANLNGGSQADRFIIKIWYDDQDPDVDDPVYRASGDLMGGNIIIHTK